MKTYLPALADVELQFTDAEIEERLALVESAKNYQNSPYVISPAEMRDIYKALFAKKRR